jgi:hypothetical protein
MATTPTTAEAAEPADQAADTHARPRGAQRRASTLTTTAWVALDITSPDRRPVSLRTEMVHAFVATSGDVRLRMVSARAPWRL